MGIKRYTGTIQTIAIKELRSFFNSPVAYIVIVVFLLLAGWFFASQIFLINFITLSPLFDNLPLLFIFLIPAITMRLIAEEYKSGTIESLSILPINDYEIITGKFIAASLLFLVCILGTLIHPLSLAFIGKMDWGQVVCAYTGIMLMGCSYVAIGLFASSLTRNQIIAYIIGFLLCFIFFIIGKMLIIMPGFLKVIISFIGMDSHVENISKGILDTRDIIYFISIITAFLYASILVVINKRWK